MVAFQMREGSKFWFPCALGRKVRVDEAGTRPTVAFLGASWEFRVVVHMRSENWIIPQWVGAKDKDGRITLPDFQGFVGRMGGGRRSCRMHSVE